MLVLVVLASIAVGYWGHGLTTYTLEVNSAPDGGGAVIFRRSGIAATPLQIAGDLPAGTLSWRVQACRVACGEFSEYVNFTVALGDSPVSPPGRSTIGLPGLESSRSEGPPPSLIAPRGTVATRRPTFEWTEATWHRMVPWTLQPSSLEVRLYAHRLGLEMWWDRPLLGHGPRAFEDLVPSYEARRTSPPPPFRSAPSMSAHNFYLRLLVESGLAGLAVFVGLLGSVIGAAVRAARQGAARGLLMGYAAGLLAFSLAALGEDLFTYSKVSGLFWAFAACALAQGPGGAPQRAGPDGGT